MPGIRARKKQKRSRIPRYATGQRAQKSGLPNNLVSILRVTFNSATFPRPRELDLRDRHEWYSLTINAVGVVVCVFQTADGCLEFRKRYRDTAIHWQDKAEDPDNVWLTVNVNDATVSTDKTSLSWFGYPDAVTVVNAIVAGPAAQYMGVY